MIHALIHSLLLSILSFAVNEETSPKYILVHLTSSPSLDNKETDVLWLDTLSPAEKIAIILAITTLLIIILTGICYNGRALCQRHSCQKYPRGAETSAATQSRVEMGRTNQEGVFGIVNQTPSNGQGNGHQRNPQIVIYNMPNMGSTSSDHRRHQSRSGRSRSASRDFLQIPRYSELSSPTFGMPLNRDAGNLSYSAPDLSCKSSPTYVTGLNSSRSAQCLFPPYPVMPLHPTAPPGDGAVFFN